MMYRRQYFFAGGLQKSQQRRGLEHTANAQCKRFQGLDLQFALFLAYFLTIRKAMTAKTTNM
jgi:hypothetical protein